MVNVPPKPDPFSKGAYEKTVNYAITLLEVHGDYDTCLKYLKGVREKFESAATDDTTKEERT